MNDKTIQVIVKNKEGVLLNETATAVTSYNSLGIFDVLPMHENFITLIFERVIVHKGDVAREVTFEMSGVMKVSDNQVHVYLGIGKESVQSNLRQTTTQ